MHPPITRTELLARAQALAGLSLGELAHAMDVPTPMSLHRAKGWAGRIIERALGAGGNAAGPDLPHLGVEIKSIPVDPGGRPRESTYICRASLDRQQAQSFESSPVYAKLETVLWVPVLRAGDDPSGFSITTPMLWSPSADQRDVLREDWLEIVDLILLGELEELKAHRGQALQLRPKAAHSKDWVWVVNAEGDWVQEVPRGFYLRRRFTAAILEEPPADE